MDSETSTASLRSQIANLQAELESLQERYDTLLEAKNRAAERYKADYKKWRDFKRWLFRDAETDDHLKSFLKSDELNALKRLSALGKRKQFEEFGSSLDHATENDHETKSVKQESICDPKSDLFRSSPVTTTTPKRQRRKLYHGEPPHEVLPLSPSGNKDPFLVPQFDDKLPALHSDAEILAKEEPSWPTPMTKPRKRKGRYAQVSSGIDTINSRFSICKDRNQGVDFQYDAVVRNRQERKHMFGSDCECCREYYQAVGPLPASRQPLWRTPTKRKTHHPHGSDNNKENSDDAEEHKQLISRHRHHWHRPKTPPGYWDIGFPDTQEVLDINRRAAEMHKRKLIEVETEANNDNGRYVERTRMNP